MVIDQAKLQINTSHAESIKRSLNVETRDEKKLYEKCEEFESIFVKQMLSSMKKTINRSGLVKRNMGEDLFEDMLYDEYAADMAKTSGFGIAKMLYKQLAVDKYK